MLFMSQIAISFKAVIFCQKFINIFKRISKFETSQKKRENFIAAESKFISATNYQNLGESSLKLVDLTNIHNHFEVLLLYT